MKHFAHAHTSLCAATNVLLFLETQPIEIFFILMDTAK